MKSIIITYPAKSTAMRLRDVLTSSGFYVSHICALGATTLGIAQEMRGGVIICSSVMPDMNVSSLAEHLPPDFDVISLSKGGKEDYGSVINLPLPLNRNEFLKTVAVLVSSESSFTRRRPAESDIITSAKLVFNEKQKHNRNAGSQIFAEGKYENGQGNG